MHRSRSRFRSSLLPTVAYDNHRCSSSSSNYCRRAPRGPLLSSLRHLQGFSVMVSRRRLNRLRAQFCVDHGARKESCFCCCPSRLITIVAHHARHFISSSSRALRPTPFIASTLARLTLSLESTVLRRPRRKESCFCCCPPRLITIVAHRLRHFHRRRTSRSSFHCSISHIAPFRSRCAHAVSSAALRQCGTRQLRRVVYDRPLHGVRSGRPCLLVVDHNSLG